MARVLLPVHWGHAFRQAAWQPSASTGRPVVINGPYKGEPPARHLHHTRFFGRTFFVASRAHHATSAA
jgi:hypothetical protein